MVTFERRASVAAKPFGYTNGSFYAITMDQDWTATIRDISREYPHCPYGSISLFIKTDLFT